MGRDCDDHDARSTNECRDLFASRSRLPVQRDARTDLLLRSDDALLDGNVMCHEGTRFCREGIWSACEDMHGYVITPDSTLSALINPDAAPENCSKCDISCFKVSDPLLAVDGGTSSNVNYASGGGLQPGAVRRRHGHGHDGQR